MHQRSMIVFVAFTVLVLFISYSEAFGDKQNIPIMSYDQREDIFNKVSNFQANNINYFFKIIITPTGMQETNVVLDQKNYTNLKNNVGFFTACGDFNNGLCEPPGITLAAPTTNYCPLAKMILLNQGDYISKLYNTTKNVDLTNYVYPVYCHAETGPNPINGDNTVAVPEFPFILVMLAASVTATIVITARVVPRK